MKTLITLIISSLFFLNSNAQTAPEVPATPTAPETPKCDDCDEKNDTTFLSFGKVKVIIYEDKDDVEITIDEKGDTVINVGKNEKKSKKFESTWEGLSIGANGALTYDNKTTLPEDMRFIELDYAKSISAAFNFADLELGIGQHFGIVTGLGIQWNRYGIKNNYTLSFNEDSIYGIQTPDYKYNRNVLKSTYITMPLLLEIHTSKKHSKSVNIALGVIGGYKLGSKLKQDYDFEGRNYEFKTKGHYQFNPFQAYATARIGYGDISLYANYGLTRIFEEGRGPQLYPFQFGLHFNF
jgi:hypothetical protein